MLRVLLSVIVVLISSLPMASPTAMSLPDQCPSVAVECPGGVVTIGVPLTFTANISGGDTAVTYTYKWTVSAGIITSGQDTPSITVDTNGLGGQPITATVDVGGLPEPCI